MILSYTERGNARIHMMRTSEKKAFRSLITKVSKDKDLSENELRIAKELLVFFEQIVTYD